MNKNKKVVAGIFVIFVGLLVVVVSLVFLIQPMWERKMELSRSDEGVVLNEFAMKNYMCTASCYCGSNIDERRKWVMPIPVFYGIIALTLGVAINKAHDFMEPKCKKLFTKPKKVCEEVDVFAVVDKCEEEKAGKQGFLEKKFFDSKAESYFCKGSCTPTPSLPGNSNRRIDAYNEEISDICSSLDLEGFVEFDSSGVSFAGEGPENVFRENQLSRYCDHMILRNEQIVSKIQNKRSDLLDSLKEEDSSFSTKFKMQECFGGTMDYNNIECTKQKPE